MRDKLIQAIALCRFLGEGGTPPHPRMGLCNNVIVECGVELPHGVFETWEEFSGEQAYPVKSTIKGRSDHDMYWSTNKWGRSKYGVARRRLCLHVADYIEENFEHVLHAGYLDE